MGRQEPTKLRFLAQLAAALPIAYATLMPTFAPDIAPLGGLVAIVGFWGLLSMSFRNVLRKQAEALDELMGGRDKPESSGRAMPPASLASPPGGAGPYPGSPAERSAGGVRPTGAAAGRIGEDWEVR